MFFSPLGLYESPARAAGEAWPPWSKRTHRHRPFLRFAPRFAQRAAALTSTGG